MNEEIYDDQDSVELRFTKKPLHVRFVSIGAVLLISLVLIIMMDLFVTALAENLAIVHAMLGDEITDAPVVSYVLAVRSVAIICLGVSLVLGFFWKKIYLHNPGRLLQKLLQKCKNISSAIQLFRLNELQLE